MARGRGPWGDGPDPKKRLEGLADWILGYRLTADITQLHHGPQPHAAMVGVLLQEFPAYTLETLRDADITMLLAILDARRARLAVDLFNDGRHGRAQLAERPDLMDLLLEMARAQQGAHITQADVLADLAANHPDEEDD